MSKKEQSKPIKRLNKTPTSDKPVLSTRAGMYAPDWDKPQTQANRVRPADGNPRRIEIGNDGIL